MFAFGKSVLDCLSISFVQVRNVCLNLCRLLGGVYLLTCCLIMSVLGSIGFHQNNNDNATKFPCSLSTLSIRGWWVRWFDGVRCSSNTFVSMLGMMPPPLTRKTKQHSSGAWKNLGNMGLSVCLNNYCIPKHPWFV